MKQRRKGLVNLGFCWATLHFYGCVEIRQRSNMVPITNFFLDGENYMAPVICQRPSTGGS